MILELVIVILSMLSAFWLGHRLAKQNDPGARIAALDGKVIANSARQLETDIRVDDAVKAITHLDVVIQKMLNQQGKVTQPDMGELEAMVRQHMNPERDAVDEVMAEIDEGDVQQPRKRRDL